MPEQSRKAPMHDDLDGATSLSMIRKSLKKEGALKIKNTEDNNFDKLEQEDWVNLDDFDHSLGKIKDIWAGLHGGDYIIVELSDGKFEKADPYTVTLAAGSPDRVTISYQGAEWWEVGGFVRDARTWIRLKNSRGEDNIILHETFQTLAGHNMKRDHPFYSPDHPLYKIKGGIYFINDIYDHSGKSYADLVNKSDRLKHEQVGVKQMEKYRIAKQAAVITGGKTFKRTQAHRRLPQSEAVAKKNITWAFEDGLMKKNAGQWRLDGEWGLYDQEFDAPMWIPGGMRVPAWTGNNFLDNGLTIDAIWEGVQVASHALRNTVRSNPGAQRT